MDTSTAMVYQSLLLISISLCYYQAFCLTGICLQIMNQDLDPGITLARSAASLITKVKTKNLFTMAYIMPSASPLRDSTSMNYCSLYDDEHKRIINWDNVFIAFEKWFIDRNYDNWRLRFEEDTIYHINNTSCYSIGQILNVSDLASLDYIPTEIGIFNETVMSDGTSRSFLKYTLLLCNNQVVPVAYDNLI